MSITDIDSNDKSKQIISAITTIIDKIKNEPKTCNAEFKASALLNEGFTSKINIRQFQLTADEPNHLGGDDLGPNPVELILGALASCQQIVIKAYGTLLGVEVDGVNVETKGKLDLRGFFNLAEVRAGFNNVEFETTIYTTEKNQEKLNQLIQFAETRCPVYDIIQNPVPVKGSFKISQLN
ncbi:MAG: OsmC family protein [Bacteroidota bacterium]